MTASRFDSPSVSLVLNGLLKPARKALATALVVALAAHLTTTQLRLSVAEHKAAKPLTTQFIKRAPRLTKPLELKKRPQPRRRQMQRRMVAVKAKAKLEQRVARLEPAEVLGRLARPANRIGRVTGVSATGTEPAAVAAMIHEVKEGEQRIDMSLELLDIETLNTGRYHAVVVQDPTDRRNIKGFCRLAVVHSARIYPPRYPSFEDYILPAFPNLVAAMNKYTHVATDLMGRITLDSSELVKTPWVCFMAFYGFVLTDAELDCLGKYLLGGGFVFADGHPAPSRWDTGYQSLRTALLDALETNAVQAAYEVLPASHPTYHCYFDFDGPPAGANATIRWAHLPDAPQEGLTVSGRLVAILGQQGYYHPWIFWGPGAPGSYGYEDWDPTRQLQFGVNTIIFALTQEGSITHRLMESLQ